MSDAGHGHHGCAAFQPGDLILGVRRDDKLGDELTLIGREEGLPGLEEVEQRDNLAAVVERMNKGGEEIGRDEELYVDERHPRYSEKGDQGQEESRERFRLAGEYEYMLLEVPEGEELAAASSLIDLRHRLAARHGEEQAGRGVIAHPNHFLDHCMSGPPVGLSPDHDRYLRELGLPEGGGTRRPRVRVIDTGYSGAADVSLSANLLDPDTDIDDDDGHGSLVASIIDDCAKGEFEVFKVSSRARRPSEWEVIQALSIGPLPPIVNLSLSLGFGNTDCQSCGRQAVSARTGTFEARLEELAGEGVIVVAAAGNGKSATLAYPSRFHSTVAAEASCGSPPTLAPYSNRDRPLPRHGPHPNVFLCPGGDSAAGEGPGVDAAGNPVDGTSFAAAYLSGLLAATWGGVSACDTSCSICRELVLKILRTQADRSFPGYDREAHGHGLARY